jgi:hypothetical protein
MILHPRQGDLGNVEMVAEAEAASTAEGDVSKAPILRFQRALGGRCPRIRRSAL